MTPLEVAAGYTAFANGGVRAEPMFIRNVVNCRRRVAGTKRRPRTRAALDPRVAYLVTSMMEDVIDHGTGATVRARWVYGAAAGKTGTSRDGWFAGYTSNLLCVVWVGFDDNRDLDLSGSAIGRADLGGIHEARRRIAAISQHAAFHSAPRSHCGKIDPQSDSSPGEVVHSA